jgi:KipI family sensor histidine kinase inhibitor
MLLPQQRSLSVEPHTAGAPAAHSEPRRPVVLKSVGDSGLLIEVSDLIDDAALARIMALDRALTRAAIPGVIETIVAYTSVLVVFDAATVDFEHLLAQVRASIDVEAQPTRASRAWRIPVAYGGEMGFDLDRVAAHCAMSPAEVVAAHAGARYTIAMFGFLPGFAYLAGLPPCLAVPRRATPRERVPAGSIAIGGAQTAIGSIEGPSGWHVIARTPIPTFDPTRYPVTIFEPGDEIRFVPVGAQAFADLQARASRGEMLAERVA